MLATSTGLFADGLEAILQAKTIQGFVRYATAVEARIEKELRENAPFLDIEKQPGAQLEKTMAGPRATARARSRSTAG
jgi:hypothetical protein